MPCRNAVGTKTAQSTNAIEISATPTSSMVENAASLGLIPSSIFRSTFSTTTIASSTTMPTASTSPNKVRLLIEKPNKDITKNVPISDTGMATSGMMVARQVCRNTKTTITTSATASKMVLMSSSTD